MKSLYNEHNASNTKEAEEIHQRTSAFIRGVVSDFEDFNPREISHLIISHIMGVESEVVLRKAMKTVKTKRLPQMIEGMHKGSYVFTYFTKNEDDPSRNDKCNIFIDPLTCDLTLDCNDLPLCSVVYRLAGVPNMSDEVLDELRAWADKERYAICPDDPGTAETIAEILRTWVQTADDAKEGEHNG